MESQQPIMVLQYTVPSACRILWKFAGAVAALFAVFLMGARHISSEDTCTELLPWLWAADAVVALLLLSWFIDCGFQLQILRKMAECTDTWVIVGIQFTSFVSLAFYKPYNDCTAPSQALVMMLVLAFVVTDAVARPHSSVVLGTSVLVALSSRDCERAFLNEGGRVAHSVCEKNGCRLL